MYYVGIDQNNKLHCHENVLIKLNTEHRFWAVVLNDDNGCLTTFHAPFGKYVTLF